MRLRGDPALVATAGKNVQLPVFAGETAFGRPFPGTRSAQRCADRPVPERRDPLNRVMPITIDDARWPVVYCRWGRKTADEDLAEWFLALDRLLDRGQRFGVVVDARFSPVPKAHQRPFMATRIQQQADRSRRLMIQALVFGSHAQRSFLNSLSWVVRQPYPQQVFHSVSAACTWVCNELAGDDWSSHSYR